MFLPPKILLLNGWLNDNIYQLYYWTPHYIIYWLLNSFFYLEINQFHPHDTIAIILMPDALSQHKTKNNNIMHKYHPHAKNGAWQYSVNMWPWEQFGCAGLGFMTQKTGSSSVITTLFLSKTPLEEVKLTEKFTVYRYISAFSRTKAIKLNELCLFCLIPIIPGQQTIHNSTTTLHDSNF